MSAEKLEALLAKLYVDPVARIKFIEDPHGQARQAGLTDDEARSLENIDWVGVEMTAKSLAKKRARKGVHP